MYNQLSEDDQLLLAVEFHLTGSAIPQELIALLGDEIVRDITHVPTEGNHCGYLEDTTHL